MAVALAFGLSFQSDLCSIEAVLPNQLLGNCGVKNSTLKFIENSIEGASGMYIDGPIDANSSCMIKDNTLLAPEPSLFLTEGTQNCTAVLAANDTFIDMGTFNKVTISGRR